MNNRYNYDRRRSYGNRNSTNNNSASSMAFLVCLLFGLGIWIATLKSDIRNLSEKNDMFEHENMELEHKLDSISKIPKPAPIVIQEEKPKKIRRHAPDTTKSKPAEIKIEAATTDTTKTNN